MKKTLPVVAALLIVAGVGLAQSSIGSVFKLVNVNEASFPAAATVLTGGVLYGTDAGVVYVTDGTAWAPVWHAPLCDSTAAPGAATCNAYRGRSAIAAAASSVVITDALVTSSSVIHATLQSSDASLTSILSVVPASGSFTINGNSLAFATTNVAWSVVP